MNTNCPTASAVTAKVHRMVTLRDLYQAIDECPSSPGWSVVSHNCKRELLICIRRIAEMRDYPLDLIDIDEIATGSFDKELYDYVLARKEGIDPKTAVRYRCMLMRLLAFAYTCGWSTSPEYALYRSWDEVRAALKGGHGFSGIIEFAIRQGKTPGEFTQEDIEKWIQEMLDKKRSLGTVIITERCYRQQLRVAGLQRQFKKWSLASKNPTEYRLPLDQMTDELRREIQAILLWKTSNRRVRGRSAKFKIRPNTANRLLEILTQLCGYASLVWGLKDIRTLRKLFRRKEVMCGFGKWLLTERKCRPQSIRTALRAIHALMWQHPLFKRSDFSWFQRAIRQLPHEAKAARRQRQIDKMIPFDLLATVPHLIREERIQSTGLSPVDIARSVRDELFMAWPSWRQKDVREFDIRKNLKEEPLSRDIRRKICMPKGMEAELKLNPYRKVIHSHHKETSTKNKKEVFEVFDFGPETLELLQSYRDTHRKTLMAGKTHSVFFVNDAGEPMCKQDVISLVTRLSVRHLGLKYRVLPHSRRRITASYALASGEKIESVQKMLWQSDPTTTWLYADAASSSSGVVALEKHYSSQAPAK